MTDYENISVLISEGGFLFAGHHYDHLELKEHEGQLFQVKFVNDENGMLCGQVDGVNFVLYPTPEARMKKHFSEGGLSRVTVISAISAILAGFCHDNPYRQERELADVTETALKLTLPHCHVRVELKLIRVRT